jgi:sarcosine oxidase subunit delta
MLMIDCPFCGPRSHGEFSYEGDATKERPAIGGDGDMAAHLDYVYMRDNPRGLHVEYWQHVSGCRAYLKVLRDTVSHQIITTGLPDAELTAPLAEQEGEG